MILDLEAVWCHWCHVMEKTTYRDEKVVALLKSKYLTVRVDQDANPDLSSRYGDWGWPATIIFASDGTELAKWRGYLPPERMVSLLEAFIADPSPGPSAPFRRRTSRPPRARCSRSRTRRSTSPRKDAYDPSAAVGIPSTNSSTPRAWTFCLRRLRRATQEAGERRDRRSMWRLNLIDREWGGIYQYSDEADWKSPHYEKIMWYQASGLRQYADAYALWKDPKHLAAAQNLKRFLMIKLRGLKAPSTRARTRT